MMKMDRTEKTKTVHWLLIVFISVQNGHCGPLLTTHPTTPFSAPPSPSPRLLPQPRSSMAWSINNPWSILYPAPIFQWPFSYPNYYYHSAHLPFQQLQQEQSSTATTGATEIEASNRLFPSYATPATPSHHLRAIHRLFPSDPIMDIVESAIDKAEHRTTSSDQEHPEDNDMEPPATTPLTNSIPAEASSSSEEDEEVEDEVELLEGREEEGGEAEEGATEDVETKEVKKNDRKRKRRRKRSSSEVIFPTTGTPETSVRPETTPSPDSRKISAGGKFVLDSIAAIGTALLNPPPPQSPPLYHHQSPSLHHSMITSPSTAATTTAHFLPHYVFPGPSALYPAPFPLLPAYSPLPMGHHHTYYPGSAATTTASTGTSMSMPSPYQALGVDSLLVPLVGLVGLSLLVPDIVKTRREGRPSDIGGIDLFRQLAQDDECLRRLACESGVAVSDTDDTAAITRALEKAMAAKRAVPSRHVVDGNTTQCGRHSCDMWFTNTNVPQHYTTDQSRGHTETYGQRRL